jgi:hypothetical protein
MNWTRPADLKAQVQKLWDRGELLASLVAGEKSVPKRLVFKAPNSAEIADHFDAVRAWSAEIRTTRHFRVEMREFRHRLFGANTIPHEVWLDTLDDALKIVGKQRGAAEFARLVDMTQVNLPQLVPWLARRPLKALELADEWERLLSVVAWIAAHPSPGIYLRQVDIPGIHSKFIEAHRAVLAELLDMALAPESIDPMATGVGGFARRYGFRDKPRLIRFRSLCPDNTTLPIGFAHDITLDAGSFALLVPNVSRVFIIENEINFLAFPHMEESLAIFGSGYGFEMLKGAVWLQQCRVLYWGDIDTHGFAILDQLRSSIGHAESFLMDRSTLMAFEQHWGMEEKQTRRELTRLNDEERTLYDDLRDNRIRSKLRLEQEIIGFGWVESAIAAL